MFSSEQKKVNRVGASTFLHKHIEVLVGRCINLTELNLVLTGITTDSLNYIIEKLQSTLVKIGLPGRFSTPVNFTKLFELKAMKKPAVLDLSPVLISDSDYILESLRRQVPNAKIVHLVPTLEKQVLSGNFRCYE
jgi:hypothetical protein